jgi:hypothetical protein
MALSPRDRRALAWGGAVIAALLLYLALRDDGGSAAPKRNAIATSDLPAAPPPPPLAAAPIPVPVAAAPAADLTQLHLVGLLATGAVIAMPDGSQRFVATGHDVLPGLRLLRVELHDAVLTGGNGEFRLGFDAVPTPPPPAPPTVPPRP